MPCTQKESLLKAYEKAVDVYSKAVKEMCQKGKDLPVLDFEVSMTRRHSPTSSVRLPTANCVATC